MEERICKRLDVCALFVARQPPKRRFGTGPCYVQLECGALLNDRHRTQLHLISPVGSVSFCRSHLRSNQALVLYGQKLQIREA